MFGFIFQQTLNKKSFFFVRPQDLCRSLNDVE